MSKLDDQARMALAEALAAVTKAYDVERVCRALGLAPLPGSDPYRSKRLYIDAALRTFKGAGLHDVAERVIAEHGDGSDVWMLARESLRHARRNGPFNVSEVTRMNLAAALERLPALEGRMSASDFCGRILPVGRMPSLDGRYVSLGQEICQHRTLNCDWSNLELLERIGIRSMSDESLFDLLELAVSPEVRGGIDVCDFVSAINSHLERDRWRLEVDGTTSGYHRYKVRRVGEGIGAPVRNLIFASNGPKPEIVLVDAIHNDIRVVKNGEYCLFYDRPVTDGGLRWGDLVRWWADERKVDPSNAEVARALYRRLTESLASPPERVLFRSYYKRFAQLGDRLPALVPQVYVHFDPQTVRELYGQKRLARQRMDFLMLLEHGQRIVVEVDGAQHYSVDGRADTASYAAMVEADRQLRLCGYEVYRFGGFELSDDDRGCGVATTFFEELLKKHRVL